MSGAHVIIAHAIKKKRQEEEEKMGYNQEELENDWEFKILRSASGKFKKYETVEQVKAEEAVAGWVMVEKFDNNRMRFKRSRKVMEKDMYLPPGVDPYRISYDQSEGAMAIALTMMAVIFGVIGLKILIGILSGNM
jgi:hypothetical protein